MTALLVDQFKNEVFVFSDGITMTGDLMRIISRKAEKSQYHNNNTQISVSCGSSALGQECRQLIDEGRDLNEENIKTKLDGTILLVDATDVTITSIYYDSEATSDKRHISAHSLKIKDQPYFSGSGGDFMAGAYYALNPRKAKTRAEFIKRIKAVFTAATQYTGTITEVTHIKTIKRGN